MRIANTSTTLRSAVALHPGLFGALLASGAVLVSASIAHAGGNPLNGSAPRPFYVVGHNPNTLSEAESALQAGANALEPDVELYAHDCDEDTKELVIYHDPCSYPHTRTPQKVEDYLDGLHDLALRYPQLALVVFDVKSEAANAARGLQLLNTIRGHLNYDGVKVNVIISVANRSDGAVFDYLIGPHALVQLDEREGVQVDGEDYASDIVNFFKGDEGYDGNISFGDGTAGPGPNLITAIDRACWLRASVGQPRAVTYVFTLSSEDSMRLFINAGVDGIIPDGFPPPLELEPSYIRTLRGIVDGRTDIRLATRQDNPFEFNRIEAYTLKVRTSDETHSGTDANITFTLEGELGSSTITVNTDVVGRMETGDVNYVTIPSRNLGRLSSITIHNDDDGNAPDWKLLDITVTSAKWLKPDWEYQYYAWLDDWVNGGDTRRLLFQTDEYVWSGFTGSVHGTAANPWKSFDDTVANVAPGGTIHVAAGTYLGRPSVTKPCRVVHWPGHGPEPANINAP